MGKPHPPTCVCWNDPNWNCIIDVCDNFNTESRDQLCDRCDHKEECHKTVCLRPACASLAAQLDEAVALLRTWLAIMPAGMDMGRLPYAKLRQDSEAMCDAGTQEVKP